MFVHFTTIIIKKKSSFGCCVLAHCSLFFWVIVSLRCIVLSAYWWSQRGGQNGREIQRVSEKCEKESQTEWKKHESIMSFFRVLTHGTWMLMLCINNIQSEFQVILLFFFLLFHTMNFNELIVAFVLRASAFELLVPSSYCHFFLLLQFKMLLYAFPSATILICFLVLYYHAVLLWLWSSWMKLYLNKQSCVSMWKFIYIYIYGVTTMYTQWKEVRFGGSVLTVNDKQLYKNFTNNI